MKPIVIIGNGSFADLMFKYISETETTNVVAFASELQYIDKSKRFFNNRPVIDIKKMITEYPPNDVDVLIGIGYSKMNTVREKFFDEAKKNGYTITSYIHPTAYISPNATIGEGNIILEFSMIAPKCRVGNGNILWDYVSVAHDCSIGNFNILSGTAGLSGCTSVGNNCFFGKHCYTEDHVSVSDYTLVGAGAGVKRDTKPYEVIVPARSISLENRKSTEFI